MISSIICCYSLGADFMRARPKSQSFAVGRAAAVRSRFCDLS